MKNNLSIEAMDALGIEVYMDVIQFLRKWRTKIQKGWCRKTLVRDKNGRAVICKITSSKAVRFSLDAANAQIMNEYGCWAIGHEARRIWHDANDKDVLTIEDFNDTHSKKTVLKSLDKAIVLAKRTKE